MPFTTHVSERFVLDNAQIWIGDGGICRGYIVIHKQHIETIGPGPYHGPLPVTDISGNALSPGLIDPFFCGAFARTVVHDDLRVTAEKYIHQGVTSVVPSIGALSWEGMREFAENVRRGQQNNSEQAARVLGGYFEGPFMLPGCSGVSAKQYVLPPEQQHLEEVLSIGGDVLRMMNVSPGWPESADAVKFLCSHNVVVSMAHSNASADEVVRCVEAGATVLGHIWDNNAGRLGPFGVPSPTLEHQALVDDRIRWIHLICDGIHVHPTLIQLLIRCRGLESICLASDTLPLAGCPDGWFTWNDGRRFVKRDGACFTEDGLLAGCAMLLPEQFRLLVELSGRPAHEVIRTVTGNVAASLGMSNQIGLIAPGRLADLVEWDGNLMPLRVWRAGKAIELQNQSE